MKQATDDMNSDSWYVVNDIDQVDSPSLVVYPERVNHNIRTLISMIDDPSRLRPHVKTHKTTDATLMMMEAGITKFKCATIAEAEMLALCGAKDVLLAYQPSGPKLLRFLQLVRKYPNTWFSCLADNLVTAGLIAAANKDQLRMGLFIDVNVGMDRTGIAPGRTAIELYDYCSRLRGVQLEGLHVYDGQVKETDLEKRKKICEEIFAPVKEMISQLVAKGHQQPRLVIGGSPSFPVYAAQKHGECSPGTFIFWDKGYTDSLPEQHFLPAALVISRVISLPDETKVCLDLGHKSIASENELHKRVIFINAPELKFLSHSEEHLIADAGRHHKWKVGDVLYGIPYHICPTCALYDNAITVENSEITGSWEIVARKRKITV